MQRFLNPLLTLLILGCRLSCPLQAAHFADDDAADEPDAKPCTCCCCPLERSDADDTESPTQPAPNTCQCFCSGEYNLIVQGEAPCPQENSLATVTFQASENLHLESAEPPNRDNLPPDDPVSGGSALRVLLQSLTC